MAMAKIHGKELEPHQNGPWHIENGMFVNKYGTCTNEPGIYLDLETGTILKCGDAKAVRQYAKTHLDSLLENLPDETPNMLFVEFDRYPGMKLNDDEVCTVMNYMQNCIGPERMDEILHMDENTLKSELRKLYEIGF